MITNQTTDVARGMVDQTAQSADHALKATQRAANGALDTLAAGMAGLRDDVNPAINRVGDQASAMMHKGLNALHDGTQGLRDRVRHDSDAAADYIKHDPLKSILMAAATGAALMALVGLVSRGRDRH